MLRSLVFVSVWLVLNPQYSHGDDMIYIVNGKRALHKVNERFLSFSVDPAVLLTGFNLSESSLQLARHLSPAFVRLAGPSTRFVKYVETDDGGADDNILITTPMWFGVNEWLISANLTPIFGINDNDNIGGGWNPKSILPLLEISDKLNVTCSWQLGYDCSNKTESQYKEDLLIFRHLLDAFPDKRNTWKIIGSDLSNCIGENLEFLDQKRRIIDDLNGVVDAIILEQSSSNLHPYSKLLMNPLRPKIPLWTTTPKSPQPITFLSSINWVKEISEAARLGYQVVFRQLRFHELFSDTPVYWVSVLYKMLMGRTVLEMKPSGIYPDLSVYAHCTKTQNNFVRSGAMTILIVNNSTRNNSILVNFGNPFLRTTEVQSFILTAPEENSRDIYLNGQKLGVDNLQENNLNFLPKLRLAKIFNYLSISIPPKSIGFFVLPVAHLSVCSSEEADLNSIVEEIRHDQNINFSDKTSIELMSRHQTAQSSLRDLKKTLQKEVETDEEFYKKPSLKHQLSKHLFSNGRDYFLERQKFNENYRKYLDLKRSKEKPVVNDYNIDDDNDDKEERTEKPVREVELELTSAEIRKILVDRAKKKAAKKNIIFTSEELDEILEKATDKFLKNGNTAIKIKRKTKRSPVIDKKITKRDINLDLLKRKTEISPNIKSNKLWKNYIANSKNKELFLPKELLNSNENNNRKTEVFMKMADSKELTTTPVSPVKIKKIKLPELPKWKPFVPSKLTTPTFDILKPPTYQFKLPPTTPITIIQTTSPSTRYSDNNGEEFQTIRDNIDVAVDDNDDSNDFNLSQDLTNFDCIHEYFGRDFDNIDNVNNNNKNNTNSGVEFSELFSEFNENKDNKLPELMSRGNKPQEQSHEDGFNANDFDFDYGEFDEDDIIDDDDDDIGEFVKWRRSINEIDDNLSDTRKQLLNQRLLNRKKIDRIVKKHEYLKRNRRQILPAFQKIIEDLPIFNRWKDDKSERLDKSQDLKERPKRYIANDVDSFENDIDNEFDKKERISKLITMKKKQQQEHEQQIKNDGYEIGFADNITDSDKNKSEINGKFNETNVNDEKIDKKCTSGNVWEQVMHGMAGILQDFTGKFKHYIKHLIR